MSDVRWAYERGAHIQNNILDHLFKCSPVVRIRSIVWSKLLSLTGKKLAHKLTAEYGLSALVFTK